MSWMTPSSPATSEDKLRLDPIRRSWTTLAPKLTGLSEDDLLKLLHYEATSYKRPLILARTLSRFRSVRDKRENKDLADIVGQAVMDVVLKKRHVGK